MSRDPLLFLEDIEKSCEKVVQYTEGRSKDQVFEDDIRVDAILLNLYVIGEAVKKLPRRGEWKRRNLPSASLMQRSRGVRPAGAHSAELVHGLDWSDGTRKAEAAAGG